MDSRLTPDAEVIVVGGGPAGASAARTLALAGRDTLIVDRAAFPRSKPCGGGLSTRAWGRFPWLRAALDGIDLQSIPRVHIEGPGGASFDVASPADLLVLFRRVEFDHALVRGALDAGARLGTFDVAQASQDEDGVTLQARDGRRVRAPVVIAADGVHSVMAKRLGVNPSWPRTEVALDLMEETPRDTLTAARSDEAWIAFAVDDLDGYGYIFPKARHVNIGLGGLVADFDRAGDEHPYARLSRFADALAARGLLAGRSDRRHFTPYLIPLGGPLARTWSGRVLFAGDAGGFVHALTAEGIYYAMASGELAAHAIASSPAGDAGSAYERLWRRELGPELADSVMVHRYLFRNHERLGRAIDLIGRMPAVADLIQEFIRGERSYASLKRRIVVRFPAEMLRIARARFAPAGEVTG